MPHRRHTYLEDPTVAPGDAMILDHFGELAVESVGIEAAIPDAGRLDERDDGQAHLRRINLRVVSGDHAALLQTAHAFGYGGRAQADLPPQLVIGESGVFL